MSSSPVRSASRSPAPSPRRRSPVASPRRHSPSPANCRFESDDEWANVKKPEATARPARRGCAFIQSERGCRKGNACTFSHDPADMADPRWHPCAGAGCTNLCRGVYCPRCRNKPREAPPRRERSRSPKRDHVKTSERRRSRSRPRSYERSRYRSRSRERSKAYSKHPEKHPAYCSQCGRRY